MSDDDRSSESPSGPADDVEPEDLSVDTPETGTTMPSADAWEQVVADMEATAADYEDRGWETLELHPGDVTVVAGEETEAEADKAGAKAEAEAEADKAEGAEGTEEAGPSGFDVLLPDNEFEELQSLVDRGVEFDQYEVFRAESDIVYALVAMEDTDEQVAVCYPLYYEARSAADLFARARETGELHAYLRRLDGERIAFTYTDPELFRPEE